MNEFGKACCFTGHRPQKLPWENNERDERCLLFKEKLMAVVDAVYASGIKHFICGMALGCDFYCAEAVIRLKERYPDITLEAAIPYAKHEEGFGAANRRRYREILSHCDKVTVVQESYSPGSLMRRNRYMVDHSEVLVACFDGLPGGTWNTIRYAMDNDREVIQLPIE